MDNVHQHKPYYLTDLDLTEAKELRNTFLVLFEKYGVDMVGDFHSNTADEIIDPFALTK